MVEECGNFIIPKGVLFIQKNQKLIIKLTLVLNAAEDSSEDFRSVQRKYERKSVRFSATIRAITEAARLFEDPGIYTYLLSFEESFKGGFGDYPIQSFFHLPNTTKVWTILRIKMHQSRKAG
ncbi:hypothetical protein F4X88_21385, partial [Candidatus Poribacteria bacterium]|nr:hypothetical protein [Candidatus Poribacteria bacterium]